MINNNSVGLDRRAIQRASIAIEALLFIEEPQAPDTGRCASPCLARAGDDQAETTPSA